MINLELCGTVLNFLGGAVLSWDALTVKKVKTEIGARHLREIFQGVGLLDRLTDNKGIPLKDEEEVQLWRARRSLPWTRTGFILMTLGFFLEILNYWVNPSG